MGGGIGGRNGVTNDQEKKKKCVKNLLLELLRNPTRGGHVSK